MDELPSTTKKSGNKTLWIIIAVVVFLLGSVCLCGVGSAVVIPAFARYAAKSKATEAPMNLHRIATGAKAYYAEHCKFPPSAGPLPPLKDCCQKVCRHTQAQTQDPGWKAVNFSTLDLYRYEYRAVSSGNSYIAEARGDLDCDGTRSRYTIELHGSGSGASCQATAGPIQKANPFE